VEAKWYFVHVTDGAIPDSLVDLVRRRIGEVGEQEAEPTIFIKEVLTQVSDTCACVPSPPEHRRRIDGVDAYPVGSGPAIPGHRDGAVVLPDEQSAGPELEEVVEGALHVLSISLIPQSVGCEADHP
jgi:hypothetical protein